jgi:hypothetical protein
MNSTSIAVGAGTRPGSAPPRSISTAGWNRDFGSVAADPVLPADVLAGFDVVVQLGQEMLQETLTRSLNENGLATLSAVVDPRAITLPPALQHAVDTEVGKGATSFAEERLQLKLYQPRIRSLRWITAAHPGQPPGAEHAVSEHSGARPSSRMVDIDWRAEISLLTTKLAQPQSPRITRGWDTTMLGHGVVTTEAAARLVVDQDRLRFGMDLDFIMDSTSATSDDATVVEFFSSQLGHDMLLQAISALAAGADVHLTPSISPAGDLSRTQVARMNLPALSISDTVLASNAGAAELILCGELGNSSRGVLSLVAPFLGSADFAFAASMSMLAPILKARWSVLTSGFSITSDRPVQLPISQGSTQTATGTARVKTQFDDALWDLRITAAPPWVGDRLHLLFLQTSTLLGLWDYRGTPVAGPPTLTQPQQASTSLSLNLFGSADASTPPANADLVALLTKWAKIIVYPVVERYRVRDSYGFASAANQTVLVRWRIWPELVNVAPGTPTLQSGVAQ